MSYAVSIIDNIVHVRYYGIVDGLDVVSLVNDPCFLPNLRKHKKTIYDFSQAEDIYLDNDEVLQFAILGKVETNFIEQLHAVIVLSGPSGRKRAEVYKESFDNTSWQVDIKNTLQEAVEAINLVQLA